MDMTFINAAAPKLEALGAERDIPLSSMTSFRVGGPASFALRPRSYNQIGDALRVCREYGLPVAVLGRGSNVLASDEGFFGLVLRLNSPLSPTQIIGNRVLCCAFSPLAEVAQKSVETGLAGMEGLCGIPGSVGGACAMNAGAYGAEISQILRSVYLFREGELIWQSARPTDFGYRKSPFCYPDCIVLCAEFLLHEGDGQERARVLDLLDRRRAAQPLDLPSAGSVFKRPVGHFAGGLIEGCGLKGYTIGGAQVSQKHAGFIVNAGGATGTEIRALIAHIQKVVFEQKGVRLECEVRMLGSGI